MREARDVAGWSLTATEPLANIVAVGLVAPPNSAHTAVIALDGDSPAVAPRRYVDAAAAWTDTNSNASPGHHEADSRFGSTAGRTAVVEVILLADRRRALDVSAAVPARPATHCNGRNGRQACWASLHRAGDKGLGAARAKTKRQQDCISQSRCV